MLKMFNMEETKIVNNPITIFDSAYESKLSPSTPHRNAVGSLSYLANTSRPDISFAVNRLARKRSDPNVNIWKGVKQLLKYLKGSAK